MPSKRAKPLLVDVRMENHQLILPNRAVFAAAVKHLPDGPYQLELRPYEETRRARANAFMWVFLAAWSRENGHTKDELHEICKMRHNSKVVEVVEATGEVVEYKIALSTAKLSIEDFSVYLERCFVDAAEMDGFVMQPRPSEDWRDGKAA